MESVSTLSGMDRCLFTPPQEKSQVMCHRYLYRAELITTSEEINHTSMGKLERPHRRAFGDNGDICSTLYLSLWIMIRCSSS
ncbi:hypothetical protein STEG23_003943 [Scotinomys teguina]